MSDAVVYKTKKLSAKDSPAVFFLYHTLVGRLLLKLLTRPAVSKLAGFFMDRRISTVFIPIFIKRNSLSLREYEKETYRSFNHFFTRRVKQGVRPISMEPSDVIAPCDGKLTAYPINNDSVFQIKNSWYDVSRLLMNPRLAKEFINGTCLIFRLTPDDYHRYCFIDNGRILFSRKIKGILHTVRPIAVDKTKVYTQNAREYTLLETENFGRVVQMEIGALFIGRIKNHAVGKAFQRGQEKGMFEFGGSTVLMLFQKDAIKVEKAILKNTLKNRETIVRMGERIGRRGFA